MRSNLYTLRTVTMITWGVYGIEDTRDVSSHNRSDDGAMREALFNYVPRFSGSGSLETTARLLASQYTTKGTPRSMRSPRARDRMLAAIDFDAAEIDRRREAYWAAHNPA